MLGDEAAELQALTSFSARVGLHRNETTVHIHPSGGLPPVARMTKAGPLRKRAAYELSVGPGLKTPAGTLSASGALDAADVPVGIVNLTGGRVADRDIHPLTGGMRGPVSDNPTRWRVLQPGLPPLAGLATNTATRLRYNAVTDAAERIGAGLWMPDYVLHPTFRFSGPGCDGFTVTLLSRKSRLDVTVHDPHVDRRLVLACLAALILRAMQHPRRDVMDALPRWRPGRG